MSERGSPTWLIDRLQNFSDTIFRRVLKSVGRGSFFHLTFILLPILNLALIRTFHVYERFADNQQDLYVRNALSIYLPFAWVALTASILKFIGIKNSTGYFLFLSFVYLVARQIIFGEGWNWHPALFHLTAILACYGMIGGLAFLVRRNFGARYEGFSIGCGVALFSLLFLLALHWFYEWTQFGESYQGFRIELLILPISVFWAEWTNVNKLIPYFSIRRMGQLLSITNFSYPVPLEDHRYYAEPEKIFEIRLRGLFDLLAAIGMFVVYCQVEQTLSMPFFQSQTMGAGFLLVGFVYYMDLYAKSYFALRLVAGLGRWIALDLKDPFNFALLASSPMDHWRRWNTFFNGWARDFIFFPMLARRYTASFALVVTFAISFFVHSFTIFCLLGHAYVLPTIIFIIRSKFVYYLLQTIAVYLAIKIPWLWPSGVTRKGWLGVALTTLVMAVLHWATYLAL